MPGNQDLLVVEQPERDHDGGVRFDRAEVDGLPGIDMRRRQADGAWRETWSLPTQSVGARKGKFGWLNIQSYRSDRFARMPRRRAADELRAICDVFGGSRPLFEHHLLPLDMLGLTTLVDPGTYVLIREGQRLSSCLK